MSEAGGGEEKGDETGQFQTMADYCIHVFIEKAKEMKVPKGETIDPVFLIETLGQKAYSTAKDDVGALGETIWNEHIFIEPLAIDKRTAEEGKITIKLMDKGLFKDALIGMFEFDLSFIYLKEKHVLFHKWLALNNPGGENFAEICGYVKVSISVAASGDEQVQITDDTSGKEDPDILMSPSLNPTFYQIKLRFLQAQGLPMMDSGIMTKSKIDAYIKCTFKKKKMKTKVIKYTEGGEPVNWNQEFLLPAQKPVLEPYINLRLMDEDPLGDETAATIRLKTKDLIDKKHLHNQVSWKNFWGSPMNQKSSDAKTEMNKNPDTASQWKGRILVQTVVEQCDKPVCKVQSIGDDVIQKMEEDGLYDAKEYAFIAQVG